MQVEKDQQEKRRIQGNKVRMQHDLDAQRLIRDEARQQQKHEDLEFHKIIEAKEQSDAQKREAYRKEQRDRYLGLNNQDEKDVLRAALQKQVQDKDYKMQIEKANDRAYAMIERQKSQEDLEKEQQEKSGRLQRQQDLRFALQEQMLQSPASNRFSKRVPNYGMNDQELAFNRLNISKLYSQFQDEHNDEQLSLVMGKQVRDDLLQWIFFIFVFNDIFDYF